MIRLLYLFVFFAFLLASKKRFSKWINVLSIFNLLWCLFGFLSTFGLYGLRVPSNAIHFFACIFVALINIFFLLFSNNGITKYNLCYLNPRSSVCFTVPTRTHFIEILSLLLCVPIFVKSIANLVNSGSLSSVREIFFSGTSFSSEYLDFLLRVIPIALLNGLMYVYAYFSFKTSKFKYLFISAFNVLLVTITNGGRYSILNFAYVIIIVFVARLFHYKNKTTFYRWSFTCLLVAIAFMIFITINRGQSIIKGTLIYYTGSYSFLDYILDNPSQFALNQNTYGYLTFGAFLEPFVLVLKVLGLTSAKVPSYEFNIYCQQYYDIGSTSQFLFNANTSILYYFIRDFGVFGVFIGSLFWGALWGKSYSLLKRKDYFYKLLFIYLTVVMFNSVMTYSFFGSQQLFVLFVFVFCSKEKNSRFISSYSNYARKSIG